LGDYDDAIPIYQGLLAKDPNSTRATIGMGRIKLTKDPAAAAALFEQVLRRDPKNLTALNNLGIARDLMGRHAEAQKVYHEALAINPDLDSAKVNLALSMAMSGQGPAAVQLLKAKATEPGAPLKVRHDYAVVLAMAGNRPEAERVLSENLSPDEIHQVLDTVTGTHTKAPPIRQAASPPRISDNGRRGTARCRSGSGGWQPSRPVRRRTRPRRFGRSAADGGASAAGRGAGFRFSDYPTCQPGRGGNHQPAAPGAAASGFGHPGATAQASAPETVDDNMIAAPKTVAMPPACNSLPAWHVASLRIRTASAPARAAGGGAEPAPGLHDHSCHARAATPGGNSRRQRK
jgi:hypothetical protein